MLFDLVDKCGSKNPPGVAVRTWWVPTKLIDTFPGLLASTDAGDTVELDGDIVLEALAKFTQIDIVTNSGEVKDQMVGELGSRSFESTFDFMLSTTNSPEIEFMESVANGCLCVLVKEKSGNIRVLGSPDSPAYLEAAESSTGKDSGSSRGITMQIKAATGSPAPFYTGAIDTDDAT